MLFNCPRAIQIERALHKGLIGRTMAAKVFISYRRDDSAGYAGRVMDRLKTELGLDLLFMDVDAITSWDKFRKSLA
jgi:hypothetical protein